MDVLTGFGDSAVLLPLSAIILVWLSWARSTGAALWWALAVAVMIGVTAVLKIYFFSCPPSAGLHSPSGHTSFSVVVYGGMAVIAAAERSAAWQRAAIWLVGIALVVGIGASRIILGSHSLLEVEVGFIVGLTALALFAIGYSKTARRGGGVTLLIVAVIAVVALLHGRKLELEYLFRLLGLRWRIRALVCR